MNRPSTSTILTITGVTVVGGLLAYAAYFDNKRRTDPSFRRRLRKEKKHVKEVSEKEKKEKDAPAPSGIPHDMLKLVYEQAQTQPLPTGEEEKRAFFMTLVQQGDQLLAMGPQNYLDAAMIFYQALRVYPQPLEMLLLYKQQVPAPVMSIISELYNMDVSFQNQSQASGASKGEKEKEDGVRASGSEKSSSEASSVDWESITEPDSIRL